MKSILVTFKNPNQNSEGFKIALFKTILRFMSWESTFFRQVAKDCNFFQLFCFSWTREISAVFKEKVQKLHKSRKKVLPKGSNFQREGCRKMRGEAPHFTQRSLWKFELLKMFLFSWFLQLLLFSLKSTKTWRVYKAKKYHLLLPDEKKNMFS